VGVVGTWENTVGGGGCSVGLSGVDEIGVVGIGSKGRVCSLVRGT